MVSRGSPPLIEGQPLVISASEKETEGPTSAHRQDPIIGNVPLRMATRTEVKNEITQRESLTNKDTRYTAAKSCGKANKTALANNHQ